MTPYIVIAGPTGSGKSALALALAERLGGEIVGCDSVQLYRGFDVGSAKPPAAERARVPHHLVDCLDWSDACDAALYAEWAEAALTAVAGRGRVPIVVGGTGLYLRALLGSGWHAGLPKDEALRSMLRSLPTDELYERLTAVDPVRSRELHPHDRFRVVRSLELVTLLGRPLREAGLTAASPPDPRAWIVALDPDRAGVHERLADRTRAMLAAGLVDEVRGLLARGVAAEARPMRSIGYAETVAMLAGRLEPARLEPAIVAATRRYAKRQTTWNRKLAAHMRLAVPSADRVVDAWAAARRPA